MQVQVKCCTPGHRASIAIAFAFVAGIPLAPALRVRPFAREEPS